MPTTLADLVILLPCHSFDDFPTHHAGETAEGLLAAWSALWHPSLLAAAAKLPTWARVDDPPADVAGKLLVIPTVVQNELPAGFVGRAKDQGAIVVRKLHQRDKLVAAMLDGLREKLVAEKAAADSAAGNSAAGAPTGGSASSETTPNQTSAPNAEQTSSAGEGTGGTVLPTIEHALVADFLALGTCYLQTELLTRRMRYLSNLDEAYFQSQVVTAAEAAVAGDQAGARQALQRCFETLAESRGRFYPVDNYLLDLTLVASTTLGQALREELAAGLPVNVLISGETLDEMAREEPATLQALKESIAAGKASVLGGEYTEGELPLLTPEELLAELERGLAVYEKHLGARPKVFARRRFGLTPVLPQILHKLGFTGALHVTLDDGNFPTGDRSKTRWEGVDSTAIEALGRVPFDAAAAASFLGLPEKLGDSMDHDHVATMSFAHWPGLVSDYYRDLRRTAAQATALGKFVTLEEYMSSTDSAGQFSQNSPDRYRSPYLQQSVIRKERDPLSRTVERLKEQTAREAAGALQTIAAVIRGRAAANEPCGESSSAASLSTLASEVAKLLPPGKEPRAASQGTLVLNASSHARNIGVDVSSLSSLPSTSAAGVLAVGEAGGHKLAVAEVPALGYVWLAPGDGQPPVKGKHAPPLIAKDNVLSNKYLTVTIHPETGAIHSVRDPQARTSRLGQQIALRLPPKRDADYRTDEEPQYTTMAIDSLAIAVATPALGEIVGRGRLMHEGQALAKYTQTTRLWAGSRAVEVQIDLEPTEELRSDPWNSYIAARFAWPAQGITELRRSVSLGSHWTDARRLEAPHFLDIVGAKGARTTILTAGLPYQRRVGERMLDLLLLVRGEAARTVRFGVAVDCPSSAAAALDLLSPPIVVPDVPAPAMPTGWFFFVDDPTVIATHWSPVISDSAAGADAVVGYRVRLLETAGKAASVALRSLHNVGEAHEVDFSGARIAPLRTEGDRVDLTVGPHSWTEIEARWETKLP